MRTTIIIGCLLVASAFGTAYAQDGRVEPTTIEALVAGAVKDAPAIVAARARSDAAAGRLEQAGLRASPELMTGRQNMIGGATGSTSVGVSLPLELGRRDARIAVGRAGVDRSSALAEDVTRQLAAEVRRLAIRALAADRLVAIQSELVSTRRDWRDLIAARVSDGLSAPVDRDAAEVDLALAEAGLFALRADAASRWAALKAAAGLDPRRPLALADAVEDAVRGYRAVPRAGAGEDATVSRSDVRAADAAVAEATAVEQLARQDGRLDMRVNAGYMRTSAAFPQQGFGPTGEVEPIFKRMNEVTLGVTIMLPWWNGRRGTIAAAAAERRAAMAEREMTTLRVSAEVVAAEARDAEAGRALAVWSGDLLRLGRHAVDVARESYEAGRISRIDVLAEERRYLELQTAYLGALVEAYEARVALDEAIGGGR
jgi:cobalt-zinc-cadmium efflux system outer membrane protein